MEQNSKIYVAGHSGLLGSSIVRELKREGFNNLIHKNSNELDLRNQKATEEYFHKERPEYVFLVAAKVGGVKANIESPADFIFDNLQIQNNVISSAHKHGAKKLLFVSSNCIYPVGCLQPMKEESLMTGKVEKTNESYAIAKIAGIGLIQAYNKQHKSNFISILPASLFGPGDNFDLEKSHLVPALIRRFHEAKIDNKKEVLLWGTGESKREIMFVDDAAKACVFLMRNYESSNPINAGIGEDMTIKEIAKLVRDVVGYKGEIKFDSQKRSGISRKILDSSKINSLGWSVKTSVREGLEKTYEWFKENYS